MTDGGRNRRRLAAGRSRGGIAIIACLAALAVVAGCTTFVGGRALSMLNDPFRVAGLPATNGPSGMRPNAPRPSGRVFGTDHGEIVVSHFRCPVLPLHASRNGLR